jgi:hypothetical protein
MQSNTSQSKSEFEFQSYFTNDGQSASLSWNKAPILGLRLNFYYCQTFAGLLMWGALSDERKGSVIYNCCWPSPAQSFSGPSPVGLVIIFYCLRLETSLFVASYDLQGHGGGNGPRLQAGLFFSTSQYCYFLFYVSVNLYNSRQIKLHFQVSEDQMGRIFSTHWREAECINVFGRKTRREKTTRKFETYVGD